MLWLSEEIIGRTVRALDDDMGKVVDVYLDDRQWIVRYFVVDTRFWFLGRTVLISPSCVSEPLTGDNVIPIHLSREMIERSPDVDADLPVSRQQEEELLNHYGWSFYWMDMPQITSPYELATGNPPLINVDKAYEKVDESDNFADPNLRSAKEIFGYHIEASDGSIGHVEDVILSPLSWRLEYLVIDTAKWLPGRRVVIMPSMIERIDWTDNKVCVSIPKDVIEEAPEFTSTIVMNSAYEDDLISYYKRKGCLTS